MNPLERLKHNSEHFTKSEKRIAEYILEEPLDIVRHTAEDIAKRAGSSKSAFIRLCQKVGYKGYSEFRYALSRYLVSHKSEDERDRNYLEAIPSLYSEHIREIAQKISLKEIEKLCELMKTSNRIKIFGYNRTGLAAQQCRMRLVKLGIDSEYSTDLVMMNDIVSALDEDDLVIIFSIKAMQNYEGVVTQLKMSEAKGVLITMNPNSSWNKDLDLTITLPLISTATERFLDDQAIFFVFIEILLAGLAELEE